MYPLTQFPSNCRFFCLCVVKYWRHKFLFISLFFFISFYHQIMCVVTQNNSKINNTPTLVEIYISKFIFVVCHFLSGKKKRSKERRKKLKSGWKPLPLHCLYLLNKKTNTLSLPLSHLYVRIPALQQGSRYTILHTEWCSLFQLLQK